MNISMIAAMANNRVIGKDNKMPWRLPADLQHFKRVTLGKPVIMGRKTYQSIGKALPGRRNIVISRQALSLPDAETVNSIEQALALIANSEEIMIIGGGEIYRQCLPLANRLYLTQIMIDADGDAFFPDYASTGQWYVTDEEIHTPDVRNPYHYRFITLEKTHL